ncbi:multidrug resistance transporter Bcr/CflA family [Vibrio ponticus]|nr:multidrug resistance transporter Bcr/CflA family [Vibrio ponticus]
MSGSGLVIGIVQMTGLEPKVMIAIQMLIVLPWFCILFTKPARAWHQVAAQ